MPVIGIYTVCAAYKSLTRNYWTFIFFLRTRWNIMHLVGPVPDPWLDETLVWNTWINTVSMDIQFGTHCLQSIRNGFAYKSYRVRREFLRGSGSESELPYSVACHLQLTVSDSCALHNRHVSIMARIWNDLPSYPEYWRFLPFRCDGCWCTRISNVFFFSLYTLLQTIEACRELIKCQVLHQPVHFMFRSWYWNLPINKLSVRLWVQNKTSGIVKIFFFGLRCCPKLRKSICHLLHYY
jgi:hypothetical protein